MMTLLPVRADECPLCGLRMDVDGRYDPERPFCTPLRSPGCWVMEATFDHATRTWKLCDEKGGDT